MPSWNPEANELFLKALDRPPGEERRWFLDEACRDRPDLRAQVEGYECGLCADQSCVTTSFIYCATSCDDPLCVPRKDRTH